MEKQNKKKKVVPPKAEGEKPEAKKPPVKKKPDIKIERVQARWTFTDAEAGEMGRQSGREQKEIERLESELASIKSDYKAKLEAAENRRNQMFSKLQDGFEMREIEAVIVFNHPTEKRKSVYRYDSSKKGGRGALVIEEPMTPGDIERDLFDRQPPGKKGETADVAEDVIKKATEVVRKEGKASIVLIQRSLQVGYTTAMKIIEKLEQLKIIGPAKGSEPREVLTANPVLSEEDAEKLAKPPENEAPPVTQEQVNNFIHSEDEP